MKTLLEFIKDSLVKIPVHNLGVVRSEMPQISSKDVPEFLKWLESKNIAWNKTSIPLKDIKLTQEEINKSKVRNLMSVAVEHLDKPVLASADNYILDGHHRIVARYNLNPDLSADLIQVNLDIRSLLIVARDFPKTFYKDLKD